MIKLLPHLHHRLLKQILGILPDRHKAQNEHEYPLLIDGIELQKLLISVRPRFVLFFDFHYPLALKSVLLPRL
jgi:hypothetical protein